MHRDRFVLSSITLCWFGAIAFGQIAPQTLPTAPVIPAVVFEPSGETIKPVQQLEAPIRPAGTIPDSPGAPRIPTGISSTAPRATAAVSDPPTPSVQLQIRTPAHIANGKPAAYKLLVTNNSGATAYRVLVRVPIPEGVAKLPSKCEPAADAQANAQQLTWTFKSLTKGEQKIIELEFKPEVGAKEIRLRGHVSFEHGSEVVTAIDKPKLTVKKTASPTVMQGELVTTSMAASDDKLSSVQSENAESKTKVLVPALKLELTGPATVASKEAALYTARVQNTGTQPLENVRNTLALPEGCEVTKVTAGARRTKDQVQWMLPRLPAGEAFDLRLHLESATSGKKVVKATAKESRTAVEDAKEVTSTFLGRADLTWKPEFDDVSVNVGKQGLITVKVKNQGTETDKGLRLRVEHPANVRFVQGTPKQYKETASEVIFDARPIPPGQTETFTITYEAKQSGPGNFRLTLEAESLNSKALTKEQVVQINNGSK